MDGSTPPKADASPIRPDFIPASDYVSPDMLRLERERLWPRVWQIVCRLEEIPKVGDFVNYKIFGDSILVTRTGPDAIKAFYNTCQHRGRRLRDEERGHAGQWYCRFHGWRYSLDGDVIYIHNREDWDGCPTFKESELGLSQATVDTWGGWVWINQDPDSISLADYLGEPLMETLAPFEFEKMRMAWRHTIIAPVNWKVVCEAFDEGYHSMATHASGVRLNTTKSPGAAFGDHSMFYNSSNGEPVEYLETSTGQWVTAKSMAEGIWANQRHIYRTLFAMVLDPSMEAYTRLREETPADARPIETLQRMVELQLRIPR